MCLLLIIRISVKINNSPKSQSLRESSCFLTTSLQFFYSFAASAYISQSSSSILDPCSPVPRMEPTTGFSDSKVWDESILLCFQHVQMYSLKMLPDSLKFYKKEMQPAAIFLAHHLSWCQSHLIAFGNVLDMSDISQSTNQVASAEE